MKRIIGLTILLAVFVPVCAQPDEKMPPTHGLTRFQSDASHSLIKEQVNFGPRVPGTASHQACREFLKRELAKHCDRVYEQEFTVLNPADNVSTRLYNIVGVINPSAEKSTLIGAHYDTQAFAIGDSNEENRKKPVPGANDGASGPALIIEMARSLKSAVPKNGFVFVLFDGTHGPVGRLNGAKRFAENLPTPKPQWGIIVDMVADETLQIFREEHSETHAKELNDRLISKAHEMEYKKYFFDQVQHKVEAEHVPLNQAGIKTIYVADRDYPAWQTLRDVPGAVTARSLQTVGDVLFNILYEER